MALIELNSAYFVSLNITNYEFSSEDFSICSHTTSLTFDLTPDQEKLPRKTLSGGNKRRTLQESNRGGSLSRMDLSNRCHVTRINRVTFNEYDRLYE